MICPTCKCEYIRGVTECADCGIPLVGALEPRGKNFADNVRITAIWKGRDPAECERVEEALDSAGIPFSAADPKSSFGSLIPTEPSMEVWIAEADQARARKILDDLDDRAHPDALTPEEIESLALPESDDADDGAAHEQQTERFSDLSKDWYDDDPVSEVWTGDVEAFADNLIACLREIGIASRKLSDDGHWRIVVRPGKEARAKEIIREVVEASPPE
jgi:hypothetical protein